MAGVARRTARDSALAADISIPEGARGLRDAKCGNERNHGGEHAAVDVDERDRRGELGELGER